MTSTSRSSDNEPCQIDLDNVDQELKSTIENFVDMIFTDSQSISLEMKAKFGQMMRDSESRILFAMFVENQRVNKSVNEMTFYALAQYFSIVLLECLLVEDFRPAKIIMNMMFTYYYEQNYDKIPPNERPTSSKATTTTQSADNLNNNQDIGYNDDDNQVPKTVKTYLYTLLKDQQIFKSIRFWTSAFYDCVLIERKNHSVFVDREKGKLSNEKRNEELDCSKNITFGLLGSFIHNMSLLDLSHEFCRDFLDKHSTIADLTQDQLDMLRASLQAMFSDTIDKSKMVPVSASEKLSIFLQKLSYRLNQSTSSQVQQQPRPDWLFDLFKMRYKCQIQLSQAN